MRDPRSRPQESLQAADAFAEEAPASEPALTAEQQAAIQEELNLEQRFKKGTRWFYWIGGLSILNSALLVEKAGFVFVIGLGITQFIGGFGIALAERFGSTARAVAFVLEITVALVVIGFGVLATRGVRWVIILGMVLYALDGVLLALCQDWFGVMFHAFALVGLSGGLKALGQLNRLRQTAVLTADAALPP